MPILYISLLPIFQSHSFQTPDHPENHWPQLMGQYVILGLAISLSKQSEHLCELLYVLPIGRISLHHCPSWMSQKRSAVLKLPTLRWYLPIKQKHLETRTNSSFSLLTNPRLVFFFFFFFFEAKGRSLGESSIAGGSHLHLTSSCLRLAQFWSCTDHFHSKMEYICACQNLWLSGSDDT